MDGFESNEGVILIAATNRPDVLDPALLRPGRFDRRVVVPRPDVKGREEILRVHTRKVPLSEDVELSVIARGTPGFSGADLANLVNESALWAARQNRKFVATKAADVLSGKLNPKYVPYIDMGDHVIVINAEKIRLTGLKAQQKLYRRYTGFPGGLREESFTRLLNRRPEKIIEEAVKGMLPKSKMGRQMGTKLKVYRGDKHPHEAQTPEVLEVIA
jgi:large subunit ribosomal protein L13